MGWTFEQGATRASLIENIKSGSKFGRKPEVVTVKGSHLWAAFTCEHKPGEFFILLCLLGSRKGYGWGYKDMTEDMGPYTYTCPAAWFDKYPTTNPSALVWREKCRRQQRLAKTVPTPGAVFKTADGRVYSVVCPYAPKGVPSKTQTVVRDLNGACWRMKNGVIAAAMEATP